MTRGENHYACCASWPANMRLSPAGRGASARRVTRVPACSRRARDDARPQLRCIPGDDAAPGMQCRTGMRHADVSRSRRRCGRRFEEALLRFGPVDILVNNAGQAASAPVSENGFWRLWRR